MKSASYWINNTILEVKRVTSNWFTTFFYLPSTLEVIMSNLSQLATALITIQNQLAKAQEEILEKIDTLQDALANVELPAEAEQALTDLINRAQALDDVVPDEDESQG
jgi:uncharacterized membrane protein YfbV (UPF0208 family)